MLQLVEVHLLEVLILPDQSSLPEQPTEPRPHSGSRPQLLLGARDACHKLRHSTGNEAPA